MTRSAPAPPPYKPNSCSTSHFIGIRLHHRFSQCFPYNCTCRSSTRSAQSDATHWEVTSAERSNEVLVGLAVEGATLLLNASGMRERRVRAGGRSFRAGRANSVHYAATTLHCAPKLRFRLSFCTFLFGLSQMQEHIANL